MANTLSVIKGADKVFFVRIVHKGANEPYDLSLVDEVKIILPKSDESGGGALTKKKTDNDGSVVVIGDGHTGKVQFKLTEIETATLKTGEALSFEVEVTVGSLTSVIQFTEVLTVIARLF